MSLNDIDAQLAELKARLGGLDSDASDDESGGGAREESRDNDPKRKSKKEKKSKKSKKERKEKKAKRARSSSSESASDGGEDSDSELAPIAPLPASCLPEHNAYAAKSVGKRRKQSKAGSPATATAAAAWARGDGTVDAADASRAGASDASPSAQRPAILELLEKRREKRAEHRCDVCDKDFTSQAQLEEHRRGKAHARAASHGGGAGRGDEAARGGRRTRQARAGAEATARGPALRALSKGVYVDGAARGTPRGQVAQGASLGRAAAVAQALQRDVTTRQRARVSRISHYPS